MRLILVLGLAAFASTVSTRALDPMLPVLSDDLGISLSRAALLASSFAFPYAGMQLVLGPIADAIGKVRLISLSLIGVGLGSVICATAPGFTGVLMGRMLAGAFAGGIVPAVLALIGDQTPFNQRQLALSRVLALAIAGQMVGATASGLIAAWIGWREVFVVTASIALVSLIVLQIFLRNTEREVQRPSLAASFRNYGTIIRNPLALLVFVMVGIEGFLFFGEFPFAAAMLLPHGGTGSVQAGLVLGSFAVGGIVYGLSAGSIIKKLGPYGMLRVGGAVAGIMYLGTLLPVSWQAVALMFFVAGGAYYTMHNVLQALATEVAPGARGTTLAIFSAFFFGGQGLGPVIGGAVSQMTGYAALFGMAGALVIALGFGAAWAIKAISGRDPSVGPKL